MKKHLIRGLAAIAIMTFASVAQGFAEYTGSNPLLQTDLLPYGAIPFDRLTPELYEQAVKEAIALQNQNIAAIVNQRSVPTFENTIVALDRSGDALNRAVLALSNVEHAVGDPAMMQVLSDVTPLLSEHEASIMLNEGLWQRIKQVYDRRDQIKGDLTPEDLRLLDETYKSFALIGAALEGADRDKYRMLNGELSDLNV
ncbi:MAG: peptidase M3, partial [Muribaculaceae bacterium]|nr:peptidase M3 [Muribaculaceae bacterium]